MLPLASSLSDFKLARSLGSGSTARVIEAVHRSSGQEVALKLLDAGAQGSTELRERLAREAVILAGVSSRHVAKILGLGYDHDQPFLVLERLHGETLDAVLKRDGCTPRDSFVDWIAGLLRGVKDCHAAGVIHRDIKPANIFIVRADDGSRFVKLIDFGVARLKDITNVGQTLTSTQHLIGSMGYMAPEQFHNPKGVGPTADLYAIGVVVFRCIAGRLPFVHRSLERLIRMKSEVDAPRLSSLPGAALDAALDDFVARALARDEKDRFQSAEEMLLAWWGTSGALHRAPMTTGSLGPSDEGLEHTAVDPLGYEPDFEIPVSFEPDPAATTRSGRPELDEATPTLPDALEPEPATERMDRSAMSAAFAEEFPTSPDDRELKVLLARELDLRTARKSR